MAQLPSHGVLELTSNGPNDHEPGERLDRALRSARLAEAAHFEAVTNIRDAQTLRLQVLKDELEPVIAARREADAFIDLALVPSEPPRLWVDMVSYVLMAPDPRTYRFCQDTNTGQKVLFETADRREIADKVTAYVAHRVIERQRHMAAGEPRELVRPGRSYSAAALLLAWLSGFSLGVVALFLIGIWLGTLP